MKKLLAVLAIVTLVAGCETPTDETKNNVGVPPAGTRLIDKISVHHEGNSSYNDRVVERSYSNEYVFSYDSRNRVVRMDYYGLEDGAESYSILSYGANTLTVTNTSIMHNYLVSGEHGWEYKTRKIITTLKYSLNSDGYISSGSQTSAMYIEEEPTDNHTDIEEYSFSALYNNHYIASDEIYIKWKDSEDEERTIKKNYVWTDKKLTRANVLWLNKDSLNELEIEQKVEYGNTANPSNVNIDVSHMVLPVLSDDFGVWLIPALGFLGKSNETLPASTHDAHTRFSWETDANGFIIKGERNHSYTTEIQSISNIMTFEITYKD